MTKAIIFSDLHAHPWQEFHTLVDYRGEKVNSRLADAAKVIDHICRYAKKKGIGYVFFAGDLFHQRRVITVPTFNVISRAIWRLARSVKAVYLLAGNHDLVRQSSMGSFSSEHALLALSKYRGVRVIDQPTAVLDGTVAMIPYAHDRETIVRGINETSLAYCRIMHAGVAGAKTGAIEFQPLEPIIMDDVSPPVPTYSGHYHTPQKLCSYFEYVGAPLEIVRGEGASIARGFGVFDIDDPKRLRRVRHKGPRFSAVTTDDEEYEDVDGNFVDLLIRSVGIPVDTEVNTLLEMGAKAVNVVYDLPTAGKVSRLKVTKKKGKLPSLGAMCNAYASEADRKLDVRRLKDLARTALEEAEK